MSPVTIYRITLTAGLLGGTVLTALLANVIIGTITNRIAALAQTDPKRSLGAALRPALFFAILLLGCYEASQVWHFGPGIEHGIDKTALAIATFIGIFAAIRITNRAFKWWVMHRSSAHEQAVLNAVLRGINVTIWIVGGLVILDVLGYQIGPLLASLGIAGIAIAVGLQDTVAGLFGGLFLILDRPLAIGDFVRIESGVEGFVAHIGWRSTRLTTADGNRVNVPNVTLVKSVVTTYSPSLNVIMRVDQTTVMLALERCCEAAVADIGAKEPSVTVLGFPAGTLEFMVSAEIESKMSLPDAQSELRKALYTRLQAAGIKLA